jgi:hypothetical protein
MIDRGRVDCDLTRDSASVTTAWLSGVGWVLRLLAWTFAALFITASPHIPGGCVVVPVKVNTPSVNAGPDIYVSTGRNGATAKGQQV